MDADQLQAMLQRHADELAEHFDSVQILAEHTERGLTTAHKAGCGSWYARQGMAHEFIEQDKAQEHAAAVARVFPSNED